MGVFLPALAEVGPGPAPAPKGKGKAPETQPSKADHAVTIEWPRAAYERGAKIEQSGNVVTERGIPPFVHQQVVRTLSAEFVNLQRMEKADPAGFRAYMDQNTGIADMYKLVLTGEQIDPEKISKLMKMKDVSGEMPGLHAALTMLDVSLSEQIMAVGLAGVAMNQTRLLQNEFVADQSNDIPAHRSVDLKVGKGKLRSLVDKVEDKWLAITDIVGGGILAGIGSTVLVGGSLGANAVTGGAAGVAAVIMGGAVGSGGRGMHIDTKGFAEGLELTKANDTLCEMMYYTRGVDPRDFTVDTNGNVRLDANRQGVNQRSLNMTDFQNNLTQQMILRMQIHSCLGDPLEGVHAFAEQSFVTEHAAGNAVSKTEQSNLVHIRKTEQRFQELILQARNNGQNPTTKEALLALKLEARKQIFGEMVADIVETQTREKDESSKETDLQALGKAEAALKKNTGEREKARTASLSKEKKTAESARDAAQNFKTNADEYTSAQIRVSAIMADIERNFGLQLRAAPDDGARLKLIDEEIKRRTDLTPQRLQELHDAIANARRELEQKIDARNTISTLFQTMNEKCVDFQNPTALAFDQATLANQGFDQIYAYINAQYSTNQNAGWPPEQNFTKEHREAIIFARAEGRARMRTPANSMQVLEQVQNAHHDAVDIMSSSVAQVKILMPGFTDDQAYQAILQARRYFDLRQQAIKEVTAEEKAWRATHNAGVEAQKLVTTDKLQKINEVLPRMEEKKRAIDALQKPEQVAQELIENQFANYKAKGVDKISIIDRALQSKTPKDERLSFDRVRSMSFADVMNIINESHQQNVQDTWDEALNDKPENIYAVVCYMAEARAQNSIDIRITNQDLENIITPLGWDETKLLQKTSAEILSALTTRRNQIRSQGVQPQQGAQAQQAGQIQLPSLEAIEQIKKLVKNRVDIRINMIVGTMTDVMRDGKDALTKLANPNLRVRSKTRAKLAKAAVGASVSKDAFVPQVPDLQKRIKLLEGEMSQLGSDANLLTTLNMRGPLNYDQLISEKRNIQQQYALNKPVNEEIDAGLTTTTTTLQEWRTSNDKIVTAQNSATTALHGPGASTIVSEADILDRRTQYEIHTAAQLQSGRNNLTTEQTKLKPDGELRKKLNEQMEVGNKTSDLFISVVYELSHRAQAPRTLPAHFFETSSIRDMMQAINEAHEANPEVGWAASENESHIKDVVLAQVEERLIQTDTAFQDTFSNANALLTGIDDRGPEWNVREVDLTTLERTEILNRIFEANRRGAQGSWSEADYQTNQAHFDSMLDEAIQHATTRFERRIRTHEYQQYATEKDHDVKTAEGRITAISETLDQDRQMVEIMKKVAGRKLEIYEWVNGWASVSGDGRKNESFTPIEQDDRTIPEYVRIDSSLNPPGPRVLTHGALDLYRALFDFESESDPKKMFETLISHPEFNPDALGAKLDAALHLGFAEHQLDTHLNRVMMAITERLNGHRIDAIALTRAQNNITTPYQEPIVTRPVMRKVLRQIIGRDVKAATVL